LSQLNQSPPSFGISKQFLDPGWWQVFVQIVIELTINAYKDMQEKGIAQHDWEEDHFTINLENFIRPLAFRHPMNLTVVARARTHTSEMVAGVTSAKQAKEIDIRLWGRWENYHEIYFAWEGKRVALGQKDKKYKDLIPEYIKEGMFRFLDGEYSSELYDAGMLGYVLAGDVHSIVRSINRSMISPRRERRLSKSDHLKLAIPVNNFNDIYCSYHNRWSNNNRISLYHLFLVFDFNAQIPAEHSC